MTATELSAADWNRITRTTRGETVASVLRPFALKPLGLAPVLDDVDERVGLVLDGLERPRTRVAKVSASAAFSHLDDRDDEEREEYVSGLLSLVARPLTRPIADLLRERFLADVAAECGVRQNLGEVLEAVTGTRLPRQAIGPEMRLAQALSAVPDGLSATVFYLATAVAYDLACEQVARELARLFLDGNFPVGIQHDGAFVVLVK